MTCPPPPCSISWPGRRFGLTRHGHHKRTKLCQRTIGKTALLRGRTVGPPPARGDKARRPLTSRLRKPHGGDGQASSLTMARPISSRIGQPCYPPRANPSPRTANRPTYLLRGGARVWRAWASCRRACLSSMRNGWRHAASRGSDGQTLRFDSSFGEFLPVFISQPLPSSAGVRTDCIPAREALPRQRPR